MSARRNPQRPQQWSTTDPPSPTKPWNVSATPFQPPGDSRSAVPCKYHRLGVCRNADKCPFAHEKGIETESSHQETDGISNEEEHDDFSREFSGASAQFEDGARILKITLPSDFSAIRLNGLLPDSTPASVSALLHALGFDVPPDCVRVSKQIEATTASANVKLEDPSFADEVCEKLKSERSAPRYRQLEALPVSPPALAGSTSRRISCKKVHVSWHKPTRLAWLNFGRKEVAERAGGKFNRGAYTILGQTVSAEPPKHSQSIGPFSRNPVAWTVVLKGVPPDATDSDIDNSIRAEYDRPRHIEVNKLPKSCDPRLVPTLIESLFTDIGPVEFTVNKASQGKRVKAAARFENESDARDAVRLLDNKPQIALANRKLTVQLVSSAKFKITTTIYDTLEREISRQATVWKERHLQFKVYRNTDTLQRFTVLKIEGEEAKEVAGATNTLEEVLTGNTIKDGDAAVWNTSLSGNGALYQNLKQVQRDHGVVVIRDRGRKELKFFGPPDKYDQVKRTIIELIRDESTITHAIPLDDQQFLWACQGGFKQIITTLGDNVATLDVASKPKRVLVTGSQKERETALAIIQGRDEAVVPDNLAISDQDCTVCWTEAENPILTRCKHHYCLECFEDLCIAVGTGDKEFCIRCQGDMGKCEQTFSLPELQDHLSSTAFEEILKSSFASFVRRHQQDFLYCPTPDCDYIYRTSVTAKAHTCTKCLEVICTACREQHSAMTCAEYKDLNSGGYEAFEKYKKEKGIKDCPECRTPMEKTEGCNHMTCRGCAKHICWVCLKIFNESGPCYAHMQAAHGGIGVGLY